MPIYANLPATVTEIVIVLWQHHPSSGIRTWGKEFADVMRDRSWGPDRLAHHFANMIISNAKRRYTFVGCDQLEAEWLGARGEHGGSAQVFLASLLRIVKEKVHKRGLDSEFAQCDGRVSMLSMEEYIAMGDWEGEFTLDDIDAYNGRDLGWARLDSVDT